MLYHFVSQATARQTQANTAFKAITIFMTAIDSQKPNLSDRHWQTEFEPYTYWLHSKIIAPLKRCVGCVNFFRLCRHV